MSVSRVINFLRKHKFTSCRRRFFVHLFYCIQLFHLLTFRVAYHGFINLLSFSDVHFPNVMLVLTMSLRYIDADH